MKKLIASLLLFVSLTSAYASPSEESFILDEKNVQNEFSDLNKLEIYIADNKGVTLQDLKSQQSDLLSNVNLSAEVANFNAAGELPLLGPFWWGCCLGIFGIALVYFITDNDRMQMKNALIGCVVNLVLLGGAWGIFGNPLYWF